MTFHQGQRVRVASGPLAGKLGLVAYQRMAAPDYREAEAVSVVLDSKRKQAGYSGTMFRPAELHVIASLGPWRSTAANTRGVPGPGPEWFEGDES